MYSSLFLRISFICAVWHFCSVSAVVKHGIIGMGIDMYKPFCCNACIDSLSPLFLNCTTATNALASTTPTCRASNEPWLQTVAYCFEQECAVDGLSIIEIQACWINMAGKDSSSYQDWIPVPAPSVEIETDAIWLNVTSMVNSKLYRTTRLSYQEWEFEEDMHSRLAVTILVSAFGFCLVAGLLRKASAKIKNIDFVQKVILVFSKYLMTPALFGSRHLVALPYGIGYIPSRFLSFVIFVYVGMNVVFSLLPIHNPWPSIGYGAPRAQIAAYFSNRVGVLSFANIALAILFAGRNNPLMYLSGFSYTSCITFHRHAARVATVQAIIHSVLFTITYFWSGGYAAYSAEAAKAYYWWGIIATLALALGVAFAILPLRMRQYEIFLISHIGFAILSLVGCWYHIIKRYEKKWGYEVYLYTSFAFWASDRLVRLVRLAVYSWIGVTPNACAELLPGGDLIKLTVFPNTSWSFQPGQHSFLYFPSISKGYESHPFSIASWTSDNRDSLLINAPTASNYSMDLEKSPATNVDAIATSKPKAVVKSHASSADTLSKPSITFIIRPFNGLTFRLREHVLANSTQSQSLQQRNSISLRVLTEGPYGHQMPLGDAGTIFCIAGGVGITAILGYVQAFLEQRKEATRASMKAERMVIAWSAREQVFINEIKAMIPADAEARGLELRFICTGAGDEENKADRMDFSKIVEAEALKARGGKLAIVSCGPASMADKVRREVVRCLEKGYRVELFEEAFAW